MNVFFVKSIISKNDMSEHSKLNFGLSLSLVKLRVFFQLCENYLFFGVLFRAWANDTTWNFSNIFHLQFNFKYNLWLQVYKLFA